MITRAANTNDIPPGSLHHRERESPPGDEPHTTPSKLARYWGVHYDTIMRDIRKGALKAYRLPSGQFRIRLSDARRYGKPAI